MAGKGNKNDASVRLDNVSLKKIDVRWLRNNIGLVGQEPKLFYGTISENIVCTF